MTIAVSSWLACGYGVVLLAVAYGIDALARRASLMLDGRGRGGFVYHADQDAWLCPRDEWLWPKSYDPQNRVMRYRGTPSVCNACPVKHTCTSSLDGREVVRQVDAWPASESARFYRGIACSIAVLGTVWPAATAFTVALPEALLLLGVAIGIGLAGLPLWSHLRRTPARFPLGVPERTLDESVNDRQLTVLSLQRRRARYGSDERKVNDAS